MGCDIDGKGDCFSEFIHEPYVIRSPGEPQPIWSNLALAGMGSHFSDSSFGEGLLKDLQIALATGKVSSTGKGFWWVFPGSGKVLL